MRTNTENQYWESGWRGVPWSWHVTPPVISHRETTVDRGWVQILGWYANLGFSWLLFLAAVSHLRSLSVSAQASGIRFISSMPVSCSHFSSAIFRKCHNWAGNDCCVARGRVRLHYKGVLRWSFWILFLVKQFFLQLGHLKACSRFPLVYSKSPNYFCTRPSRLTLVHSTK